MSENIYERVAGEGPRIMQFHVQLLARQEDRMLANALLVNFVPRVKVATRLAGVLERQRVVASDQAVARKRKPALLVPVPRILVGLEARDHLEHRDDPIRMLGHARVFSLLRDVYDHVALVKSGREHASPAQRADRGWLGLEVRFAATRGIDEWRESVAPDSADTCGRSAEWLVRVYEPLHGCSVWSAPSSRSGTCTTTGT
jgi:hypothetical protein